jgi:hypothetical protein
MRGCILPFHHTLSWHAVRQVATLTLHVIQYFYSQLKTFVQQIRNETQLVNKTFPFALVHEVQEWYIVFCNECSFLGLVSNWISVFTMPHNKNQAAWNFVCSAPEVTCRTVAFIIRVVLLSPYMCIPGISLSSIHYNQSCRVYINQKHQHIRFICA